MLSETPWDRRWIFGISCCLNGVRYLFFNYMPNLVLPSFAKINLSLRVLGKRPDGFHDIFTIFQTISLCDLLEFEETEETRLECDNESIPLDDSNTVISAIELLRKRAGVNRGVTIRMQKRIPSPGGLGGASSNAAVTLIALSKLWELNLEQPDLEALGCELGSDVPFFFCGGTAIGTGRGTDIEPLSDYEFENMILVSPEAHVSTPEAYSALGFSDLTKKNTKSILEHYRSGSESLYTGEFEFVNDFETVVFDKHLEVRKAVRVLKKIGARTVSLSGSGPSLFGLFDTFEECEDAKAELARLGISRSFFVEAVTRESYFQRLGISYPLI